MTVGAGGELNDTIGRRCASRGSRGMMVFPVAFRVGGSAWESNPAPPRWRGGIDEEVVDALLGAATG